MEEIKRQVAKAQRRLNLDRFLGIVAWSMFATLLVAAIGLAIPRIWALPIQANVWNWSWIGGGVALGLVIASVWTYFVRRSQIEAAIELDRRFGLKERVSSSLALTDADLQSEAAQALLHDASQRVETIDVNEQFRVAPSGRIALPLVPAVAIVVLMLLVPFAVPDESSGAGTTSLEIKKEIKKTKQELKTKIEQKAKEAEKKGLKDAEALFKQMDESLEESMKSKDPVDQKKALIKLDDLAKQLKEKREKLGGAEKIKEQMEKLQDIEQGPADKTIKAMKDGDFGKAMEEFNKLKEKIAKGELTKEEKEKLANQLQQMQEKLQEMADKHEQAKKDLQEQIKQAEAQGDRQKAGELQQKLDKLQQMDQQMQKMQQLADKLGQAAEAAKNGDPQQAAEQLDQLAQDMKQMQQDMENMQMVDEMMNEVAQAKNGLCERCEGLDGEEMEGEGEGMGKGKGKKRGRGMGEGEGTGDRPEEKTDSGFYDSNVNAKPKKGEAVRKGQAGGPNMAGRTSEDIKEELNSAEVERDDPLVDVNLPKSQREHAQQYFNKLRKGE